jgi:L-rhamnose mutarotase
MREKHYKSVFENETELLKAILDIHCGGAETFEVDPFYFKGNFYKDMPRPTWCSDLNPQFDFVEKEDVTQLWSNPNISEGAYNSIILDPPFLFGIHGKAKEYYSSKTHTIFPTLDDLEHCYHGALKSANYALRKGGICVFKCQDYTDSKTTMTHVLVKELAERWGFYPKDLAILVKPNKIYNPKTTQRHFRKIHTYFWIFEKKQKFEYVDY